MIIILLGAPGAGKGTQSEVLEDRLRMVHVSSGDLLSDHRKRGTELGKIAQGYRDKGDWCNEHDVPESQCFKCNPKLKEKFAKEYTDKYGEDPPPMAEKQADK